MLLFGAVAVTRRWIERSHRAKGDATRSLEPKAECNEYMTSTGCAWTKKWACPDTSGDGADGFASDDGSIGFR